MFDGVRRMQSLILVCVVVLFTLAYSAIHMAVLQSCTYTILVLPCTRFAVFMNRHSNECCYYWQ